MLKTGMHRNNNAPSNFNLSRSLASEEYKKVNKVRRAVSFYNALNALSKVFNVNSIQTSFSFKFRDKKLIPVFENTFLT